MPSTLEPTGYETEKYTGDWNKHWPTAENQALKQCTECKRKLEKPKYGYINPESRTQKYYPHKKDCHYQECLACDLVWLWSFGNIYKEFRLIQPQIVRGEN